jgi:hypothetical protein
MSDHITDGVGMAFALDEIRNRRTKAKGNAPDNTMATRIARSVWEDWNIQEPTAEPVPAVRRRISLVERVLWQVGELFVRGGQWLQERFCAEPACA